MNTEIQKRLVAVAELAGLKTETANDTLTLSCGGQHSEERLAIIDLHHPQYEAIFSFLRQIGQFKNRSPLRMPWFINRPYETEILGEAVYRTRRTLRQKFGKEWRADLWALCAYSLIGCPDDLKDFLQRHPEKRKLMLYVIPGVWKARLITGFHKLLHRLKIKATPS